MVVAIRRAFAIPGIWFVTGGLSCCFAGKETAISTSDPVVYDVRMTTTLKIPGGERADRLRVWHALPDRRSWSLFSGGAGATEIQFSSGGKKQHESDHDSHHILWESRDRLNPGEVHRFLSQFQVRSVHRSLLPAAVTTTWAEVDAIPPSLKLSSEGGREDVHPRVKQEADRIRASASPYDAVIEFSKWVEEFVRYDASVNYPTSNLKAILDGRAGHCGHRAKLFRELCGAVGIPVRTILGLNLDAEDGKDELSDVRADFTNIHTWVEIYLPGAGWVEVDPAAEGNPFSIPSRYIRNNAWFQNYSIWARIGGSERQPAWTLQEDGKFASDFHVEHLIEFRAKGE